jgi:hypothetical protein
MRIELFFILNLTMPFRKEIVSFAGFKETNNN